MLVFDGAFGVVGIVVSWVSLTASGVAGRAPSDQYPFGRQSIVPLIVVLQGVAAGGTILLAAGDAIIVILSGGKPVDAGIVVAYSAVSAVASFIFVAWLRRISVGSDLLAAEALAWRAGAIRGVILTVGALAAIALAALSFGAVLNYIDPILVLISCALLIPMPIRLLREGSGELLERAPSRQIATQVEEAIQGVATRFAIARWTSRSSKVGAKLYVEVTLLAEPTTTIRQIDEARAELRAALTSVHHEVWLTTEFTTDESLLG